MSLYRTVMYGWVRWSWPIVIYRLRDVALLKPGEQYLSSSRWLLVDLIVPSCSDWLAWGRVPSNINLVTNFPLHTVRNTPLTMNTGATQQLSLCAFEVLSIPAFISMSQELIPPSRLSPQLTDNTVPPMSQDPNSPSMLSPDDLSSVDKHRRYYNS